MICIKDVDALLEDFAVSPTGSLSDGTQLACTQEELIPYRFFA